MIEALLGLLCLVIVVVLVTVVGHGFWVLVAAIFSGGSAPRPRQRERDFRRRTRVCVGCGDKFDRDEEYCPECGLDPGGTVADELKDLEAAARTVQRLRENGTLSAESCEQIYKSIETRQGDLLPNRRRPQREILPIAEPTDSLAQLEVWFGADLGSTLAIDERKQALAMSRLLTPADLRELSPHALIGIARLQASVGMMSRACQVYRALFQCHPTAPISADAAVEALEVACKLKEWSGADEMVRAVQDVPGLVDERPELARLIAQVAARDRDAAPPPVVTPVVVPAAPMFDFQPIAEEAPPKPAPVVVAVPATPRRSFAEWIAVFMETRNILWGELIGGTLIVGSSIALVISLWSTLEEIPFFPFLILAAITSALFGAGLYTLHHWKLESTSRGLLLIATLLVPLDFLVLAGLTRFVGAGLWDYVTACTALVVFGWFLYRSAHILIQEPLDLPLPSALLTTIALLISAAAQLLAPVGLARAEAGEASLYLLTLTPVLAQIGAIGWLLLALRNVESWSIGRLVALLIALGSMTFACSVTLSLPLYLAEEMAKVLLPLSPALTLLGVPILIAGTLIHQKLAPQPSVPLPDDVAEVLPAEPNALWRTLGTGLGLVGLFVMFGGFAVSVEDPMHRWLCGSINIVVLLAVAWMLRVPALHVLAQAYVVALIVYGWSLDLDAMFHEPTAALRLTGLLALQTFAAEALIRLKRRVDARYYAVGGGVTTALIGILIFPFARTHPGELSLVFASASLIWYAANLRWRIAAITYACSLVLAGAILFAFRHYEQGTFVEQLVWSFLTHATVCLGASLALRAPVLDGLRDSFRMPLKLASLLATFAVAAIVGVEQFHGHLSWPASCAACCWLAAVWLVISVVEGWPALFGAFQLALSFAWFFGASAWLTTHEWAWLEPHSLHIYALGLGTLCLAWEVLRIGVRKQPRALALISPDYIPIDRFVTGGLVLGQYVLSLSVAAWSIAKELSHSPDVWRVFPEAWYADAFSIAAWLVPLLLAGVLILWLREFDMQIPLLALTLLFLSLPYLIAGAVFDEPRASASSARWGLAFGYSLGSLLLWNRNRLGTLRSGLIPVRTIRTLFVAAAVLPIVFLSLCVVIPKLSGGRIPGPLDGVFAAMDSAVSQLIPLALVSMALAGHGFRERLAYYLSAAGWLTTAIGVGAYFLVLQRSGVPLREPWVAPFALLLAAGVSALWSIVWTWVASLLEDGEQKPLLDSALLSINSLGGAAFFGLVLTNGLVFVVEPLRNDGVFWSAAAGSPWGWLVYAVGAFGACLLFWKRRGALPLFLLGGLGFAAAGIVACSIESYFPGNGLRSLMLLLGLYACVWIWSNLLIDPANPPRWLTTSRRLAEMETYALLAGVVAVPLACIAALNGLHPIESAETIALTAFAGMLLAYRRKTEGWASLSTILAMIASTILVLHLNQGDPSLWLLAVQVNVAVLGTMSLVRIGLHRYFAPPHIQMVVQSQLIGQIFLGMLANLLLFSSGLFSIVLIPIVPHEWLEWLANWAGWLALATNAVAAIWYLGGVHSRWVIHALAISGLMLGVLLAGSVAIAFPHPWMAHHVVTLAWTLGALFLLILSWVSHAQAALGPQFWPADQRAHAADFLRFVFPEAPTRAWVTVCGMLVVSLALEVTWVEPETPYWSVGNTFAVSVLLGALAVWSRAPLYQFGSGLLFNVIGLLLFRAWSAHRNGLPPLLANDEWGSYFVLAQILSFGAAAIVWSMIERTLHRRQFDLPQWMPLPFTQLAILAGIHLLAIGIAFANGLHLSGDPVRIANVLAWIALGVLAGAALLDQWRPHLLRFTRFQLYSCGLMAQGLLLHGLSLSIANWYWTAMLLLAGYVLLIVMLVRLMLASPRLQAALNLPAKPDAGGLWFWNVQLGSIGLVLLLSLWITLTYSTWQERLGGALASTLVTAAAFLLVQAWPRLYVVEGEAPATLGLHHRFFPSYLVLTLGVFIALEACWTFVDRAPAVWLQRTAAAFAVIVAATLLYRFGLPRLLKGSTWSESSRALSAVLGIVGVTLLLLLLGQELVAYDAAPEVRRTPLRIELVACGGLAILGLALLSLHSALSKATDLYGIENERRSAYVYLAEFLAAGLFFHMRLNVPDIFSPMIGAYWYLIVMVIAFIGLALSEIFMQKSLPVLATPLKRSAIGLAFLPVLAFRIAPLAGIFKPISDAVPGLSPFFRYLETLSQQAIGNVPMESLCWLLLGIFFGWLAQLRKSANYGIAAALAINFGVWVLLGHQDVTAFFQRPQLWLIPLGVIILVAEYVNRERLGFWPSLSVRYVGLLCIYLSSTIEMIVEGFGSNPIFPIVLAVLAVAGMMLGILFRVRAFLLSGFMALLVVIFAQIWLAAVVRANTWVWWVCGIILGVMILSLFALFEKHRNEVLKMLDNMKRWR